MSTEPKHPILIVDDEPDVLFSLKGLLRHDFELYTAESGEQALEILRKHPIHVVMTDQRMPGMTGTELMDQAKALHPDAVRIVFTGYADIKAVVEAINTGGLYRYITKPWDPDELIDVLHHAARRYDEDAARITFAADVKSFVNDVVQLAEAGEMNSDDASTVSTLIDRGNSVVARANVLF
ncbi:MAG: response regulator [Fuerstiella sp.]|nr:response regulator [Fuerstiella sp.]MCP4782216.1 response regulator [Fuerstiella sp.]MCP4855634.1 response regulator [Fuerstiella sp.]